MRRNSILLVCLFLFLGLSGDYVYSASDHLVISEVQIAGDTTKDEFVELYNPTSSEIDLASFRLTKKPASASSESNLVAGMSGAVAAGGYYLVAHPDYNNAVLPDLKYSAPSNSLSDNNILTLYDGEGLQVDKVGFGTATEFETASTENPVDNGSVRRIGNVDTDDNSSDFELLEISDPQNSASGSATPAPTPTESPSPAPTPSSRALVTFMSGGKNKVCRLEYSKVRIRFLSVRLPRVRCN